jgi:hypothetical protein
MRDAGCGMRGAGCGMRDTGCAIRDARCGMRDAGRGLRKLDTVCSTLTLTLSLSPARGTPIIAHRCGGEGRGEGAELQIADCKLQIADCRLQILNRESARRAPDVSPGMRGANAGWPPSAGLRSERMMRTQPGAAGQQLNAQWPTSCALRHSPSGRATQRCNPAADAFPLFWSTPQCLTLPPEPHVAAFLRHALAE